MFSSRFSRAALISALAVQLAEAYTQVNAPLLMYKNIDPILFPGSYTESHLHSFFGSDAVTASTSTSAELQQGCTGAENPNDLSVYCKRPTHPIPSWNVIHANHMKTGVPTLLYTTDDGATYEPVPLSRFSAYYNLGETPAEIGIPQNVKMIAGESGATTADESPADAKVEWFCEGDSGIDLDANGFPSSTCSTHLQTLLYFPSCVNPDTLETAYKSRDYGTDNWCPEGSSSMPQLRFSIRYDLRDALSSGWSGTAPLKLACGNAWCSHGDFINGWTEEAAELMVATTNEKQEFSSVNGALGDDGTTMDCTPADAEPDQGTSDYAESVSVMGKRRFRSARAMPWSS